MGKLNIAHHKSYHPYRLDNIERVRKDEEEARRKEERQEDRMRIADSEARLELLRAKADPNLVNNSASNVNAEKRIPTSQGHINLFADLEQQELVATIERARLSKQSAKADEEKGIKLAPSAKDLKPWYVDERHNNDELPEDKRMKDLTSKMISDPLTSIKHQLSKSYPHSQKPALPSTSHTASTRHPSQDRIRRESTERARAMELIRKKQKEKERELLGSVCMTPSTVYSEPTSGYRDVYNPRETEAAHRQWDRRGCPFRDKRR